MRDRTIHLDPPMFSWLNILSRIGLHPRDVFHRVRPSGRFGNLGGRQPVGFSFAIRLRFLYTVRMTQERRRTNTIGYWAIFAACQGLWGVALLLAANVHGTSVVTEIISWLQLVGWLLLLPSALLTAKLTSLEIPTAAIYLLRVAANLIVWYVIGTKLRVSSRPK